MQTTLINDAQTASVSFSVHPVLLTLQRLLESNATPVYLCQQPHSEVVNLSNNVSSGQITEFLHAFHVGTFVGCRWVNPLIGWTSTSDPLESVARTSLSFYTKEEAIAFAIKVGWDYELQLPHAKRQERQKRFFGYGDNFGWVPNNGVVSASWACDGLRCRFNLLLISPRYLEFWGMHCGTALSSTSLTCQCISCID